MLLNVILKPKKTRITSQNQATIFIWYKTQIPPKMNLVEAIENFMYCQAQFKSSSVPVQLGTETGLIITVRPTHPTHPPRTSILQVPRKLKFGMQANFTTIR